MKDYKFYKPVSASTVAIPCYVETVYDSNNQCITFQRLLNDHFGRYTKAIIHVPAEFNPELVGDGYLSLARYDDDIRYSIEPAARVTYVSSKGFALIKLTKESYNNRFSSEFEYMHLHCNVDEA